MESTELRIFQAVAREGSITKAAQVLGYVQSNVTARIQQLETQLNTQLFYRQRGMVLTPTGEKLLVHTERILHLLDEAEKAVNDEEPAGRLALGANQTTAAFFLPKVLAEYHKLYPRVDLSLITSHSYELAQMVNRFQLHGAFVTSTVNDDNIVKELAFEEELVLIAGPEDRDLHVLCTKPFLINSVGCSYRTQLDSWLSSEGFLNVRYMEFNHFDAIIGGVISGLGVSLVPKSSILQQEQEGLLKSFALPAQYSSTKTFFIRHKDSLVTSALTKFIDLVEANTPYHTVGSWDEGKNV